MFKILIIFFGLFFSSCCRRPPPCEEIDLTILPNPRDQMVYAIMGITSQQLEAKYGLVCCGEGETTDNKCKLKEIQMDFRIDKAISKDEGTRMVIDAAKMVTIQV